MVEGIITIVKDREKPIRNQHPWIFSGAISKAQDAEPGDIVKVIDHKGIFLGRGYWNAKSQIQVRMMTWQDETIDETWWRKMIRRAVSLRSAYAQKTKDGESVAYRLINAENDFMPGLVVDCYDNWLVMQAQTLYIDQNKQMLAKLLLEITHARGVYERSDIDTRLKEGLKMTTGALAGLEPPATVTIVENGNRFQVDIRNGHKTGFYLDQRDNRQALFDLINQVDIERSRVLNLFGYTGGFGVSALRAGDSVERIVNVDSSADALALAQKNFALNLEETPNADTKADFVEMDCFDYLRACVQNNTQFDIIVCDPPKFAPSNQLIDKAARGYKDLNLNAFKIIRSGGYMLTFSCSGAISRDLFQKIVFGALADSGRQAQVLQHLSASPDHPVALTFPEGEYLKGLLLRVY